MLLKEDSVIATGALPSKRWWKDVIIYELYVDCFAHNFQGLTEKINYLKTLGVECVHILPHYPSPMVDDGYDIADYRNVRHDLGTLEDFEEFVSRAHDEGIRVIIDLVLNHTSTEHKWFVEARSSMQNSKRDFYIWSKTGKEYAEASNPFSSIKPSNWIYNDVTGNYYFSTFYPKQADLNWDNQEVFSEMMQIIDFWVARGVDGFRLDAAPYLIKKEGMGSKGLPETHAVLKKIRAYVESRYPGVVLLAEAHETVEKTKEYFGEGNECHLAYHFSLVEQIFLGIIRNNTEALQKMISWSWGISENCQWATFLRNHDELSLATLSEEEREEVFNYFDPHAQYRFGTGIAMRLATLFRGDTKKVLDAFRTLFDIPGSPIIYYGEEIGMENITIRPGEKDARRGVRGVFDWKRAGQVMQDPASLFSGVRALCEKRKLKRQGVPTEG